MRCTTAAMTPTTKKPSILQHEDVSSILSEPITTNSINSCFRRRDAVGSEVNCFPAVLRAKKDIS